MTRKIWVQPPFSAKILRALRARVQQCCTELLLFELPNMNSIRVPPSAGRQEMGSGGRAFNPRDPHRFASGFLAAGFSTLASPYVGQIAGGNRVTGTLISAVLGGASSVLGGGKFANGAITGAFAYAATSLAEQTVTTASPAATFGAGPVNTLTPDTSHSYSSYEEAQLVLKVAIETASAATGWEYGGYVLQQDNSFYISELGTSQSKLWVTWDTANFGNINEDYDILAYDHTHLQSIMFNKIESGMRFSADVHGGDVTMHNILVDFGVYRGSFVDWQGSMYYLNGSMTYGHNMLGVQGSLCANFPRC